MIIYFWQKEDKNTLFSIASIISNVTNSIPPKKPTEEMLKLAEYAKHHVPETHKLDKEKHIKERPEMFMQGETVRPGVVPLSPKMT